MTSDTQPRTRAEAGTRRRRANGPEAAPSVRAVKRMDLQGLRALAVGLVILNHAFEWPAGGFVGVDIFFVISGFLMTSLLYREFERTGKIDFLSFYRRRIRRLIPASVLVIGVTVVAAWFLFASGRFLSTVWDAVASLFFVSNWRFAAVATDYFAQGTQTSPLQHYWSLSLEEQYYLVWPVAILLIALLARRLRRPLVLAALTTLALTAALFVLSLALTEADSTTAYFITPARLWELSVGATIAFCMLLFNRLPDVFRPFLALASLAGMLIAATITPSGQGFPAPWAAVAVLSTAVFIAFPWQPKRTWLNPLDNTLVGYLGDISYSLYLWHFPALILVTELSRGLPGSDTPIPALQSIALSLVLAALSYRFVEEPIRHSSWLQPAKRRSRARGITRLRSFGLAAAAVLVVAAVGISVAVDGMARNGSPDGSGANASGPPTAAPPGVAPDAALAAIQTELADALAQKSWPELTPSMDSIIGGYERDSETNDCSNPVYPGVDKCTWGAADAPHSVAIVGDSTAVGYVPMLRALADASNGQLKVTALGMYGCPFVDFETENGGVAYNKACPGRKDMAIEEIAAMKPDAVFITNTYIPLKLTSTGVNFTPSEYQAGLKPFLDRLAPSTGKIVFLSPPPEEKDVRECYTPRSSPEACVSKVQGRWQAIGSRENALAEEYKGAWIDTRPLFCVKNTCPSFSAGMPIKFDLVHVLEEYSRHIANGVVALLAEQGINLRGEPAATEPPEPEGLGRGEGTPAAEEPRGRLGGVVTARRFTPARTA